MWHFKFFALTGALVLLCALPQMSRAETLISDSEAKLPSTSDSAMATRGLTRGPGIDVLSPAMGTTNVKSPLPLKIKFMPRNNADIDLTSVRLTYLKAPPVDLTDRIKKFTTKDGIEMPAAEVPPGTHILRLDLKDAEGRAATSTITLTVAP
jgi:hypothetical protein